MADLTDVGRFKGIEPGDLPSLPQAALEVVRACAREDVGNVQLSRLAGSDPVLTAELLRVANSPFFGIGREIRSLSRAITVLGHVTVRNLALCLAVRESIKSVGVGADAFWEDALIRGAGARLLGQAVRLDADECFTAGILQDFGMHVLLHLSGARADVWLVLRSLDPDARRRQEEELYGTTHDDVIRLLAHSWELPPDLARSLGGHHQCGDALVIDVPPLARVLYLADWMATVYRGAEKGAAIRRCRELTERYFNLPEQKIDQLLAAVPAQVQAAAGALGVAMPDGVDYERVLAGTDLTSDDRD